MTEEKEREQRSGRDRRAIPPMSNIIVQDHSKWMMTIIAAVLGGIIIGWYNDVREMKPEVAKLQERVSNLSDRTNNLSEKIDITNKRLEALTEVLIRSEERAVKQR